MFYNLIENRKEKKIISDAKKSIESGNLLGSSTNYEGLSKYVLTKIEELVLENPTGGNILAMLTINPKVDAQKLIDVVQLKYIEEMLFVVSFCRSSKCVMPNKIF